jgi:hypothetical protein
MSIFLASSCIEEDLIAHRGDSHDRGSELYSRTGRLAPYQSYNAVALEL